MTDGSEPDAEILPDIEDLDEDMDENGPHGSNTEEEMDPDLIEDDDEEADEADADDQPDP